jgi:succinate-acetate transporter protein
VGLWGIAAFTSLVGSITFNQIFAVVYLLQAILGLLPATNTLFGTMPLYGNNVWLSILTAAIAFYYGFVKPVEVSRNSNISTPTSA